MGNCGSDSNVKPSTSTEPTSQEHAAVPTLKPATIAAKNGSSNNLDAPSAAASPIAPGPSPDTPCAEKCPPPTQSGAAAPETPAFPHMAQSYEPKGSSSADASTAAAAAAAEQKKKNGSKQQQEEQQEKEQKKKKKQEEEEEEKKRKRQKEEEEEAKQEEARKKQQQKEEAEAAKVAEVQKQKEVELALEVQAHRQSVAEARAFKPAGPTNLRDREINRSCQSSPSLVRIRDLFGKEVPRFKELMFKMRIKKGTFGRTGFHQVLGLIIGNFFFYFPESVNDVSKNATAEATPCLGHIYLYGAKLTVLEDVDNKRRIQLESSVQRKKADADDNIVQLGFENLGQRSRFEAIVEDIATPKPPTPEVEKVMNGMSIAEVARGVNVVPSSSAAAKK